MTDIIGRVTDFDDVDAREPRVKVAATPDHDDGPDADHLRRSPHGGRRWVAVILLLLAVGYVVVPMVVQLASIEQRREQVVTPPATFDAQTIAATRALRTRWDASLSTSPLVLTYHEIAEESTSRYSVTPAEFEQQMALLAELDATSINGAQLADYLNGGTLPDRAVLITFDDGPSGMYRYGDPILERHGFNAIGFIITGSVGTAGGYYVTWNELEFLRDSGRWELESHTAFGHGNIPTSATGDTAAFLTARMWLDKEARLETYAEYEERLADDLAQADKTLGDHRMGTDTFFSFPFSDAGQHNSDPQIAEILWRVALKQHKVVLLDSIQPLPLGGPTRIVRRTALAGLSPVEYLQRLDESITANEGNDQ